MAKRIQLSRKKGWRLPQNTVNVARPSKFGNPFRICDAREAGYVGSDARLQIFVVETFRNWLAGDTSAWMGPEADAARERMLFCLPGLRGKNLACWCKPGTPCHAEVLLELANEVDVNEECLLRDPAGDADPECTCCGGTGITWQTERLCACQPAHDVVEGA